MAGNRPRPGRTLAVFFLVVLIAYVLCAVGGTWKPKLGLDLAGGTTITLVPVGNPGSSKLNQAANIIRQRVNGNGVTEATVSVSGEQVIVSVPGKMSQDLVDSVSRQAQLRFRVVASSAAGLPTTPSAKPSSTPTAKPTSEPSKGATSSPTSKASPSATASAAAKPRSKTPAGTDNRPAFDVGAQAGTATTPSPKPSAAANSTATPTVASTVPSTTQPATTSAILAWAKSPDQTWQELFAVSKCLPAAPGVAVVPPIANTLTTTSTPNAAEFEAQVLAASKVTTSAELTQAVAKGVLVHTADAANQPLIACDASGNKYLLSDTAIEGKDLTDASAGIGQNSVTWQVNLSFNGHGADIFADLSRAMVSGGAYAGMDFAIVLDGTLLSAPGFDGVITGGQAQISGNFTQDSATALATSLKYGSLPVKFASNPTVDAVGPTLAGNQLSAGIIAGVVGLVIVMLYCLLYYRGLGLVVIASLIIAAGVSYAAVLLLGKSAGFTLSLPGIAGLMVAVGITADSFIVYFERIRDEMRDGKSMRLAVQAGWLRARNTCLAADTVSLLAAVALYLFAIDVIRGFAFALGISTLIDLAVFFFFTHPTIQLVSRRKFFNSGHPLSGLSRESLGFAPGRPNSGKVGA